jgi:hypothetical protein
MSNNNNNSNDESYVLSLLTRRKKDNYDERGWIKRSFENDYKQLVPTDLASFSSDDQIWLVKDLCNDKNNTLYPRVVTNDSRSPFSIFQENVTDNIRHFFPIKTISPSTSKLILLKRTLNLN